MKSTHTLKRMAFAGAAIMLLAASVTAQPTPPTNVQARDASWDRGEVIVVTWSKPGVVEGLTGYRITRTYSPDGLRTLEDRLQSEIEEFKRGVVDHPDDELRKRKLRELTADLAKAQANEPIEAGRADKDAEEFKVGGLDHALEYIFHVSSLGENDFVSQAVSTSAISPRVQLFDGNRGYLAIIVLILCGSIISFIMIARAGVPLKIRRIAGLEAVDEAVGRATEMGRPILFVPGIQDMNDMMTLAGLTALSRVAKTVAEYDAKLEVPTSKSLVMTAARETVQGAFFAAGRPDAYNADLIYYVTDEQFGYVAYLSGHMVRDKPAACFYFGAFFAESLILAETGNAIGAIQIAGTAETAQLPFFVAACDYTLIGEEFYAASAYLSGEPDQLGSLRGQDIGKIIVAAGLIIGCVVATGASLMGPKSDFATSLNYIKTHMLR